MNYDWSWELTHLVIDDTPDERARAEKELGRWGTWDVELTPDEAKALLSGKLLAVRAGEHEYTVFIKVKDAVEA